MNKQIVTCDKCGYENEVERDSETCNNCGFILQY